MYLTQVLITLLKVKNKEMPLRPQDIKVPLEMINHRLKLSIVCFFVSVWQKYSFQSGIKIKILFFIFVQHTLVSQTSTLKEIQDTEAVSIYSGMINVSSENNILLFESTDIITSEHFLKQLTRDSFSSPALKRVNYFQSNRSNYWMLLPVRLADTSTLGIAFMVHGCQNDSVWILDKNLNTTQKQKIPINNFKKDLTGSIIAGNLPGIGLNLTKDDRFILINTINYSYSKKNFPVLFDAKYYTAWYFKFHLSKFVFFLFISGVEIGLILYFLLHFFLLREKYLFWYILYVIAQLLPNIDFIHWAFSDQFSFPYSWFNFKVFHLCTIMITYLFFIRNILSENIKIFNRAFHILVPLCLIIFIIDTILLIYGYEYWSGVIYTFIRSFVGLFCLTITSVILFLHRQKRYRLLFAGSLCIVISETIGWLFFTEYRSYIINLGILLEYLFFSYLINQVIKQNEKERLMVKSENIELIKKQEELKQSIAQDIHDEVGSIITKLNLELQLDKLKNNDPIQLKAISHYQNYVEKIREGLKDLVQIIDNKAYDFRDFKASVREIAYDYLENTTIRLQINMPEHIQNPILSYQIKRNLECILKEALQNILKHSQASNVTMELNINHGIIMFNIMDDGIGIHTSTKSGSKGLTNIRQRIIKLNGMLKIISSEHEIGTKLIMQIPY